VIDRPVSIHGPSGESGGGANGSISISDEEGMGAGSGVGARLKTMLYGGFRILQRQKIFKKISCPLWVPFILETDIEYTVWGIGNERHGIWKGKEVGMCIEILAQRQVINLHKF